MDELTSQADTAFSRIRIRITAFVAGVCLLLWITGQLLRDSGWFSGLCFYIPSPALFVFLVLASFTVRRRRRLFFAGLSFSLLPLISVTCVENQWTNAADGELRSPSVPGLLPKGSDHAETVIPKLQDVESSYARLRLIHWNVCRFPFGWDGPRNRIRSLNPDIIVLSEVEDLPDFSGFEGLQTLVLRDMLIGCRESLHASPSLVRGGTLHAFAVDCRISDLCLKIVVADHTSNIRIRRDPQLRDLMAVAESVRADLVVGDLNAPRLSLALQEMPLGFRHAYEAAGSGWSYTWPVPFPCLAIDQCICGPRIQPVSYQLQSTRWSDHRLQILDFDVPLDR